MTEANRKLDVCLVSAWCAKTSLAVLKVISYAAMLFTKGVPCQLCHVWSLLCSGATALHGCVQAPQRYRPRSCQLSYRLQA